MRRVRITKAKRRRGRRRRRNKKRRGNKKTKWEQTRRKIIIKRRRRWRKKKQKNNKKKKKKRKQTRRRTGGRPTQGLAFYGSLGAPGSTRIDGEPGGSQKPGGRVPYLGWNTSAHTKSNLQSNERFPFTSTFRLILLACRIAFAFRTAGEGGWEGGWRRWEQKGRKTERPTDGQADR